MPEPGRVLTRPVVERILARAENGQRPFAAEARSLARSHEQLREALERICPSLADWQAEHPASPEAREDIALIDAALSAGEETP